MSSEPEPRSYTNTRCQPFVSSFSFLYTSFGQFLERVLENLTTVWNGRKPDPLADPKPIDTELPTEVGQDPEVLRGGSTQPETKIPVAKRVLISRESRRQELKQVTKELALARRFLSTVDTVSEADVVRALEALNEEIFQLTSMIADEIQLEETEPLSPDRLEMLRSRITALGPVFWDGMRDKHLENSLAIQVGWQAILVDWCSGIIGAWVVTDSDDAGVNRDLGEIYEDIKAKNGQAVAGCWRAIARGVSGQVSSEVRRKLEDKVISALVTLPVSCTHTSEESLEFSNTFRELIGPLINKCLKIRKMIGEEITSTDIQPRFIKSGDLHDAETAELDYEDDRGNSTKEKGRFIACSLSLGLDCTCTESGPYVQQRQESILKPKVILQETLRKIVS